MNYVDENKIFVGNGDTFYYTFNDFFCLKTVFGVSNGCPTAPVFSVFPSSLTISPKPICFTSPLFFRWTGEGVSLMPP